MLALSTFLQITDSFPVRKTFDSFEDFANQLGPHTFGYVEKLSVPAFSPAEYPEGATRSKHRVLQVNFGVLDLDGISDADVETLLSTLKGQEFVFYTTWSHEGGEWCARLLVPFSRPVTPSEWPGFWGRMNTRFGGLGDPACKDPSRLYFIPAAPKGNEELAHYEYQPGAPLDVDALLKSSLPPKEELAANAEMVSRTSLEEYARKLTRRRSEFHKDMGARLVRALKGEPFAQEGERDQVIFQMTGLIVERWPNGDAHQLAMYFSTSLSRMGEDCPDVEEVAAKIIRHQEQRLDEEREEANERADEHRKIIKRAFANCRDYPYTEEEQERFAASQGTTRESFRHRWVIQADRSFYVYFNGAYAPPCGEASFMQHAMRDLSPAVSAGVELWSINRYGEPSFIGSDEVVKQYGSAAHSVVVDLAAQAAHYDERTRTFVEAPTPLRPLSPRFDVEVDEWLRWLAGPEFEALSDWLAVLTNLDEPCAALYLDGVPGAGKTLLADGLARLWSEDAPSTLDQAMASFNDGLVKCPLVLGDETIPKDARGRVRTADIRQFIQARTRPLKRKFLPDSTLRGCIRLIVTANNRELLVSGESLTNSDIRAIVDRFIYIQAPLNAARYLQSLPWSSLQTFVRGDRIARHALWLRDNRTVARGKRFLVEGSDSALHRQLTTASGLRSAVCNWLVGYLLSPSQVDSTSGGLVRVSEGKVWATSRALAKHWKQYETNEEAPPPGRISQALAGLSNSKKQFATYDGRRTHFWGIDSENLIVWAEANGYATRETILEILRKDTQRGP